MKTDAIVLLIAVICIQSELSLGGRSKNKNAKKINANKPQTEQPTDNNQNIVPVASSAPAKGPATTSDNNYPDMIIIKGDKKGVIKIDGKTVEANDSQLKKGIVWVNIGRGYIVINNNVILDRKPVKLGANVTKFLYEEIDNFEIKVMKNGRVEYTDDTFDEGDLLSAQMY